MHYDIESKKQIDEYINKSRKWYFEKYLSPRVDLWAFIVVLCLILVSFYVMRDILRMDGVKIVMKFPIYVENESDEQHYIKSLAEKDKSIDDVFATYMVKRYVMLRESYSPQVLLANNWYNLLMNISAMSTYEVFDAYLAEVLPSRNPDSPVIRLRFSNTLNPYITSVVMSDFSGSKPTSAIVYFDLLKCDENYANCLPQTAAVKLRFEIKYKPEFGFKVREYVHIPPTA